VAGSCCGGGVIPASVSVVPFPSTGTAFNFGVTRAGIFPLSSFFFSFTHTSHTAAAVRF